MSDRKKAFKPGMSLKEYSEYYKERFEITRKKGIVQVKMHSNGGPALFGGKRHQEWGDVIRAVGSDPKNEVLIITGAGDLFESGIDPEFLKKYMEALQDPSGNSAAMSYDFFRVQERFYKTLLFDVDIPVIAAIHAPGGEGGHMEWMLYSDIRLCAPDVIFGDSHFENHSVPGGGALLVLQEFIGTKRANYLAYTGKTIDAQTAKELGLVDEIVDRDKLEARAWELAAMIMKQPRASRRLTHRVMRKPVRETMCSSISYHNAMESWCSFMAKSKFGQ